jgi:predicted O-methyltransferase YrrM
MTILSIKGNGSRVQDALNALGVNGFHRLGGTDKATDHSYAPVYEALARLMPKASSLVEVGVFNGGSMLLWQRLFPSAQIIGIDCSNNVHLNVQTQLDNETTRLLIDDAYSQKTANQVKALVKNGIDIAIDDGPHTLATQAAFLELYGPLLSPGGIAIVEDIVSPEWLPTLKSKVPSGWEDQSLDMRHIKGRADDIMFIMRRPSIET